jgi:hypothetical protein
MSVNAGGARRPKQQSGTTSQAFIVGRWPTPKAFYFLPF